MFYFAYGSNMNPDQMHIRVGEFGKCVLLGSASLVNHALVFDVPDDHAPNAGYANVQKKKGSIVNGVLYELDNNSFAILDKYEHVPILYTRELIYIHHKKELKESYIYLGTKSNLRQNLHPTKRYLNRILLGKDFLPKDYFENLSKLKTSPDQKFDCIKESIV